MKKLNKGLLSFVALIVITFTFHPSLYATSEPPSAPQKSEFVYQPKPSVLPNAEVSYFKVTFIYACLILAGSWVAYRFFLKGRLSSSLKSPPQSYLNILETRIIGLRQYLMVVDYKGQKILIGTTPDSIQYLCALDLQSEDEVSKSMEDSDLEYSSSVKILSRKTADSSLKSGCFFNIPPP